MFCKAYVQSLKDTAASGEMLSPALQQHLASCESCRTAFAEEQSLFSAIDSSLHAAANSEVPSTLIPRVRVATAEEPQGRTLSFFSWAFAGAAVATAAIVVALLIPFHRPSNSPKVATNTVPPTRPIEDSPAAVAVNPPENRGVSIVNRTKPVALAPNNDSRQEFPEVIVSPDEQANLLRYEALLRKKLGPQMLLASAKPFGMPPGIEPLQIVEIDFGDLEIQPLSKSNPDVSRR